jgi:hypothetical protein
MPKNEKKSSSGQDESQENDSVFDFLYQDVRRVGSYLAQLMPGGHVQGVKQTLATEESGGTGAKITAAASAVLAKASGEFLANTGNVNRDILERTFDPIWRNAIELLDVLEQRHLISRNVAKSTIGGFVVVSGTLGILDRSFLQLIWSVPELRTMLENGIASGIDPMQAKSQRDKLKLSKALVKTLIALPESLQARLSDDSGNLVYSSIQESGLVSTTTELFLSHGIALPGKWSVLGILDAQPGEWLSEDAEVAEKLGLINTGTLPTLMNAIQGLMREAGRPAIAYGVTPLLIFRKAG